LPPLEPSYFINVSRDAWSHLAPSIAAPTVAKMNDSSAQVISAPVVLRPPRGSTRDVSSTAVGPCLPSKQSTRAVKLTATEDHKNSQTALFDSGTGKISVRPRGMTCGCRSSRVMHVPVRCQLDRRCLGRSQYWPKARANEDSLKHDVRCRITLGNLQNNNNNNKMLLGDRDWVCALVDYEKVFIAPTTLAKSYWRMHSLFAGG